MVFFMAVTSQAYSDLQPFTDLYRHPPGTSIDMTSAPVILHLMHDLSLLDYVAAAGDSMENCDFKKVSVFFHQYLIGYYQPLVLIFI